MPAQLASQGALFLEALAAGAILGMLYDLCRVLRERWRRRAAAALLDFGF